MTFSEAISKLNQNQVDNWWKNKAPEAPTEKALKENWKYHLFKDGKKLPFKWALRSLFKNELNKSVKINSDYTTRIKFCRAFGFEIKEDLVYDSTHLERLKDYYLTRIHNKKLFKQLVNHLHQIVSNHQLEPYNIRAAISSSSKSLLVIGMRAVFIYRDYPANLNTDKALEKAEVDLIIEESIAEKFRDSSFTIRIEPFDGFGSLCLIKLSINHFSEIPEDLLANNKKCILEEYNRIDGTKRSQWNVEAKTTNDALKAAIFKNLEIETMETNRESSLFIEKLAEEILKNLKSMKHPLSEHQWYDKNTHDYWWISAFPNTQKMSSQELHYELVLKDDKVQVELHPEGSIHSRERFREIIEVLDKNTSFKKEEWNHGLKSEERKGKEFYKLVVTKSIPYLGSRNTPTNEDIKFTTESLIKLYNAVNPKLELVAAQAPKKNTAIKMNSLNQILYGPPGTGKTYNTVLKTLSIIEDKSEEELNQEDRKELKRRFDKLVENNQVVFTTFHQSMSYEDFVEGIKPIEPEKEGEQIIYKVVDGIFKKTAINAFTPNQSDFEKSYSKFVKANFENEQKVELTTPTGKTFGVDFNRNKNLNLYTGEDRKKQGVLTKENIQKEISGEKKFDGWDGYFRGIINHLEEEYNYSESDSQEKNYVLIIDEINRGNVSQIFGELITLIEEDKRTGNKEALKITLPYSKEKFSVPNNLYIIGTMNTADRSVEALDSALRRRFSFQEKMPEPELLSPENMILRLWNYPKYLEAKWNNKEFRNRAEQLYAFLGVSNDFERNHHTNEEPRAWKLEDLRSSPPEFLENGINLKKILNTINERIEVLIDRDHTIGHSYFMGLELKDNVFDELKTVFKDKVIPLLQEYFFNDYGKLQLVLGKGFVKHYKAEKVTFATTNNNELSASDYNDKMLYQLVTIDETFDLQNALKTLMGNTTDEE